jgi:hypothetical protein
MVLSLPELTKTLDDPIRAALQYRADHWLHLLMWSTRLVLIGVAVEGIEFAVEIGAWLVRQVKRKRERTDLKEVNNVFPAYENSSKEHREFHLPRWVKFIAFIGLVLVVVGVAGELDFDDKLEMANGDIQSLDNERLTAARKEAEDERTARIQLEENVEWRKLTTRQRDELKDRLERFSGQVANTNSYQLNPEAATFVNDLVSALKWAKWKATLPSSLVVLDTPLSGSPYTLKRGITVMSSRDKVSRDASKALVRTLNDIGFDADDGGTESTRSPMVSIDVHLRPDGPQGEAKLRAEAEKKKQAQSSQTAK